MFELIQMNVITTVGSKTIKLNINKKDSTTRQSMLKIHQQRKTPQLTKRNAATDTKDIRKHY